MATPRLDQWSFFLMEVLPHAVGIAACLVLGGGMVAAWLSGSAVLRLEFNRYGEYGVEAVLLLSGAALLGLSLYRTVYVWRLMVADEAEEVRAHGLP
jgi:hypothetical protein